MKKTIEISIEGISELNQKMDRLMQILQKDEVNNQGDDSLMDLQEAALFLKLKPATIYNLTHKQELPHMKAGKKLVFRKVDLLNWLNKKTLEANEARKGNAITKNILKLNHKNLKN